MPNGQGGEEWRGFMGERPDTATEIRRRMESLEQRMQRRREAERAQVMREFYRTAIYNNTLSDSVMITGDEWFSGSFDHRMWFTPPPKPKPKRPTRPVSAIFYTMVNECGY